MSPDHQLRIRAHRVATDGLQHSPAAIDWARRILAQRIEATERRYPKPNARERAAAGA